MTYWEAKEHIQGTLVSTPCSYTKSKRLNITILYLQDRSIAVWDMQSSTDINLRRVLVGHRAAVNVVDFDDKYIVSASGDRTIKVCGEVNVCDGYKYI